MAPCEGVMIVEDDASIREVVSQILMFEGYTVHTAENGRQALDRLKTIPYPVLILLDLMMPVMNGWQFLEARKNNAVLAELPVVVVSAVADPNGTPDATEVMRKPPDIDSLLEVVHHHCRPARHREPVAA
jgi:CheY-like chemotaxis protein